MTLTRDPGCSVCDIPQMACPCSQFLFLSSTVYTGLVTAPHVMLSVPILQKSGYPAISETPDFRQRYSWRTAHRNEVAPTCTSSFYPGGHAGSKSPISNQWPRSLSAFCLPLKYEYDYGRGVLPPTGCSISPSRLAVSDFGSVTRPEIPPVIADEWAAQG
ncbi:hypothetical protein BGZ63DRAFT_399133 [Mariannaea sp. PMI_226]|nr:hypothetical protein BGZ63DRAFT_399133 [Mariannaea sp. PMI_226]